MTPTEPKKDETPADDLPFVNDECGDYMWEEALKKFEENEKAAKGKKDPGQPEQKTLDKPSVVPEE
jgi:hypothetical protein